VDMSRGDNVQGILGTNARSAHLAGTIFVCDNLDDLSATLQELHCRMITIFPCGS